MSLWAVCQTRPDRKSTPTQTAASLMSGEWGGGTEEDETDGLDQGEM